MHFLKSLDFNLFVHGSYFISILPFFDIQWKHSPFRHLGGVSSRGSRLLQELQQPYSFQGILKALNYHQMATQDTMTSAKNAQTLNLHQTIWLTVKHLLPLFFSLASATGHPLQLQIWQPSSSTLFASSTFHLHMVTTTTTVTPRNIQIYTYLNTYFTVASKLCFNPVLLALPFLGSFKIS